MDPAIRQERLELFARRSSERGMPVTPQRRAVLETVLHMDNHPTADQVHAAVVRVMPELNRTTVYRSLETLVALGVVTRLCHPGRVARFDPRTDLHHHLICMKCGDVIDFEDEDLNRLPVPDASALGFEIEDFRVQLRGTCQECQKKKENPR